MAKRITFMIDDGLDRKLRSIQAKKIIATGSAISYSAILNEILERGLK